MFRTEIVLNMSLTRAEQLLSGHLVEKKYLSDKHKIFNYKIDSRLGGILVKMIEKSSDELSVEIKETVSGMSDPFLIGLGALAFLLWGKLYAALVLCVLSIFYFFIVYYNYSQTVKRLEQLLSNEN